MREETRKALFAAILRQHEVNLEILRKTYVGKEVTLVNTFPTVSRGRAAIIDAVMIDRGIPHFLCMVLRSGGSEKLNTETWTRCYRPWSEFIMHDGAE